jgi:hypothetical protein
LSSFGASVKFDTRGNVDTAHGWAFGQNNGSQVEYNSDTSASGRRSERGFAQITSWYESGTGDSIRIDGAVISKASGTNAGDTAATSVELVLGNRYGGTFEGSINKYSEFVLFEGTVSTGDRDAVEASQKTYFLKRKRLVFFGDSLVYGANLGFDLLTRESEENISAHVQALLGDGYDVYNHAVNGSSLDNIDPTTNQTTLAPLTIQPLFMAGALKNVVIFWGGWNDMQSTRGRPPRRS